MGVIEIMNFVERLLEIFPVIVVMDDVSNVPIQSSNHAFTDDDLSQSDLVSKVGVRAKHDKRKHLVK